MKWNTLLHVIVGNTSFDGDGRKSITTATSILNRNMIQYDRKTRDVCQYLPRLDVHDHSRTMANSYVRR